MYATWLSFESQFFAATRFSYLMFGTKSFEKNSNDSILLIASWDFETSDMLTPANEAKGEYLVTFDARLSCSSEAKRSADEVYIFGKNKE